MGLWPKIPQKRDGILMEPAISEPSPMSDAPAPSNAAYKMYNKM